MKYLATFHTHYGAMRFQKYYQKNGVPVKMLPVPRELSASCGVCVIVTTACAPNPSEHEDMDCCYTVTEDGAYAPVS